MIIDIYKDKYSKNAMKETKRGSNIYKDKFININNMYISKVLLSMILILGMMGVASAWTDDGTLNQNVDDCGTLNTTGAYYTINQSITTTGTCITITANNTVLDMNGFSISGDNSGQDYGIYGNKNDNVTIKNGSIINFGYTTSNGVGIYLINYTTSKVQDIYISTVNYGAYFKDGGNNNINNINIYHAKGYGIILLNSNNNFLNNTLIEGIGGSATSVGLGILTGAKNNHIYNLTIFSAGYGLYLNGVDYNVLNNLISYNNFWYNILIYTSTYNNLTNTEITGTTFIDCMRVWVSSFNNFDNLYVHNSNNGIYMYQNSKSNTFTNLVGLSNANTIYSDNWGHSGIIIPGIGSHDNVLKFNNTNGEIIFDELKQDMGSKDINLSTETDIFIKNNLAYLNSTAFTALNQSANITLIGLDKTKRNYFVLKDGVRCTDCTLYSTNNDRAIFNVLSWSNYSISGEEENKCKNKECKKGIKIGNGNGISKDKQILQKVDHKIIIGKPQGLSITQSVIILKAGVKLK